jgi:hypothetical protein
MQPEGRTKIGIIESTSDLSSSFSNTQITGFVTIKDEDGNLACPPIPRGSVYAVNYEASAAEVCQHVLIAGTDETIVANTRYTVGIEFPKDRVNGSSTRDKKIFPYVMGTLSSAAADRATVYTALYNKINAYVGSYTKAKLAFLMNMTGDIGEALTVGQKVYEKSGTWVGLVLKAITLVDGNAASVLVCTLSGTAPTAGEDIVIQKTSNAGTDVLDGTLSYTAAQGLVVYDEGGYFSYVEKLGRGGAPFIMSSTTFLAARPLVVLTPVESRGIGTEMLADAPQFDQTKQNVDRGDYRKQYTQSPVSGSTYTLYIIRYWADSSPNALDGSVSKIPIVAKIYVKEAVNGTYHTTLTTIANYA